MINGIKSSRQVQETKAGDLLCADGTDDEVVQRKKNGFSRAKYCVGRLKCIEKRVFAKMFG